MNAIKNKLILALFVSIFQFGNAQNISVDEGYTPEYLVNDVLINSTCANVFNITVSGGNFASGEKSYGFFDGVGTSFPFQNGIILSTGKINNAPGPNSYLSDDGGSMGWNGDNDLNTALGLSNSYNATILEFDFIPLGNRISFDYIFSSEQYLTNPSANQCNFTDGFAFLLKEASSTTYQNLAVVPGTNTPVKVNTVRGSGTICPPANAAYFDAFNDVNHPTNYNGQTKVLTAESDVTPGVTYHIKLVIADEGNYRYDSAIFLGGGSFNFTIDIGDDRLIANGNPLCQGENLVVDASQTGATGYQWFQNSIAIPGATNATYNITSAGDYLVEINYGPTCQTTGSIKIEYAEDLIINEDTFTLCDADTNQDGITLFDLDVIKNQLFTNLPTNYVVSFFETTTSTSALSSNYTNTIAYNHTIYARVINIQGCYTNYPIFLNVTTFDEIILDEEIGLCENDVLILNAGPGFSSYLWDTNPPQNSQQILIASAGTYHVTLTNANNCSKIKTFTIIASSIAIIEDIIINDFQENNTATIQISSSSVGDYEFSLDGINYQDSNVFSNLNAGEYIVYVQDKNGCGIVFEKFYILDYPKYFTPNGDGYNDTWFIDNLDKRNLENSIISIFDRYGKLLKQINGSGEGWNGTFNETNLPSTDYWFEIKLTNEKTIKGHFSLKR
ncbi:MULTISPECIES: T9SS type B sorting domain-containing protein [unclassified Flavobacterium]|uniref:T9SS type B sorting domain-containing protein n=1 Tax=unclassified Flavobacterium TaxID=196869 RepID=UPI001290D7E2|nr:MULTISPECIES: choice-of-anchor L domain-containing protein [unclassified Flavobacterium]MQP52897.1 T9SS type B sorting domain-containing protein [Flavobacterium sp. LMO9]MQP63214.1 T9SS type B sorting domain-containing protein [Flavobacterium sp. LMO6]